MTSRSNDIRVLTRTSGEAPWEYYGEMTWEQWQAEQPHIEQLRLICPLYIDIQDLRQPENYNHLTCDVLR